MTEKSPSRLLFFLCADAMFKKQTGQKPPGTIVQADQTVHVQVGIAVIPGAHIKFAQEPAGGVFGGEDQHHVDEASHQNILFAENLVDGGHGSSHAIDGKHQQRSVSHEPFVSVAVKTAQAGGKEFHGPSDETTFDKIILHGISMVQMVVDYVPEIEKLWGNPWLFYDMTCNSNQN